MESSSIGLDSTASGKERPRGVVVVIGEVLWDCFPDHRVLGGAPLNVAWNLRGFGFDPIFVSAVGDDDLGHEAIRQMQSWGLSTDAVQLIPGVPTGHVQVTFVDGEPAYDLVSDVAYDRIGMPSVEQLAQWADRIEQAGSSVLYHGSLAFRCPDSRATIEGIREWWPTRGDVFLDINVRMPHFDQQWLERMGPGTSVLKLNEDEMAMLMGPIGEEDALDAAASELFDDPRCPDLNTLLVTLGEHGAVAYCRSIPDPIRIAGVAAERFKDSVGAGDAFSSVVLACLSASNFTKTMDPSVIERSIQRATRFASKVCGLPGATTVDAQFYSTELDHE
ncbi:MAG: PfkB family carbohydrate kinase [Planctomycetota bacterium]